MKSRSFGNAKINLEVLKSVNGERLTDESMEVLKGDVV